MNRVILIGNIAKDPEIRSTSSGIKQASFDLAVQRRFKDKTTGQREADFIRCVAWRQPAEFIEKYCGKGTKLAVEGALQTRSYEAQDGSKRYVTEVVVDNVESLQPRQQPSQGGQPMSDAQVAEITAMFGGKVDNASGFEVVDDTPLPF